MKLQFNNNTELFFPDFGIYKPNQIIEVNDELKAKKMLSTGYFKTFESEKPLKINIKNLKNKGSVLNAHRHKESHWTKKRDNLG